MSRETAQSIAAIDKSIAELQRLRDTFVRTLPLHQTAERGQWVIDSNNRYFKFMGYSTSICLVKLDRNGNYNDEDITTFDRTYRRASGNEVKQHEEYLAGKKIPPMPQSIVPDFYMITVKGERGAVIRHEDYATAETEAKRLATKCNHRAHIMGVVAIVDPKSVISYEVTRK